MFGLACVIGIPDLLATESVKRAAVSNPLGAAEFQDRKSVRISGNVISSDNQPLSGVTVIVEGTTIGTITGADGEYSLNAPSGSVIVFSLLGYEPQKFAVEDSSKFRFVTLYESVKAIEDVVVVGFGTQKKESVVSSITTISPKELKGPTSNLTTMLAGRISGMISYQRSGEPGQDNAQFFIRGIGSFGAGKVDPLILIDGIESSSTDLARLQPDDIEAFSVLKDATAAAVYGARGANGVVLVSTKEGEEGKTKFNFRAENSVSSNTRNFRFADNITYMELANEAAFTRNPLAPLTYSLSKIEHTKAGDNPILYPNNNWIKELIKDYTMNQRFNANLSGGGKVARYYISGTFNIDNGVLKNDPNNNFKNNIKLKNYSIRSNTEIDLTKTTVAKVRVYGQFDDYSGPIGGGSQVFNSTLWSNPVAFPAFYPSSYSPFASHTLFGNAMIPDATNTLYINPYAQMVSGYQAYSSSTVMAQLEFEQDFSFITEGLSARVMGYTQRYGFFSSSRQYNPFYYTASIREGEETSLTCLNPGGDNSVGIPGTEYLNYSPGERKVNTAFYGEAVINYNRKFGDKHDVGGMLIGTIRHSLLGEAGTLEASLPSRNMGLSGRFSYAYDSRYFLEFNFGYNGSERFAANNRWGFFPSIGGGWTISNESFFKPAKNVIRNLKLRASYGLVGNDQIGNINDRFFYMSSVDLNNWGRGYTFGEEFQSTNPGVSIARYANFDIGWEESRQLNVGLDLDIWDLNIIVDVFKQRRSNILLTRSFVPSTMGLQSAGSANVGKASTQGVDVSLDYNKFFSNGLWTQIRGTFTYATSDVIVYDEPSYSANESYRTRVGRPIGQVYGYIAERLFIDDYEVANSPTQSFGEYEAGDIKYRDVNGDGQITDADMVPIGYPTSPEINYGFGATMGYKGFDFSFYFQGSARSSIFIDPKGWRNEGGNLVTGITPFASYGDGRQSGLLNVIAESHWSEDNRDSYAFWPRLSDKEIVNNSQTSTWWMRNGSFLRLKSVELGYNLPSKQSLKIGLSGLRIYLNASNLFAISKFKMWDPEMGGRGLGYPVQRTWNIGLNISL